MAAALAAAAIFWLGSTPAQAQSCSQEGVNRADFVVKEIVTYKPTRVNGRTAFEPDANINRDKDLNAEMTVLACGKYARLMTVDGRSVFVRRSAYKAVCTCASSQAKSGSSPGSGSVKMCKADICQP